MSVDVDNLFSLQRAKEARHGLPGRADYLCDLLLSQEISQVNSLGFSFPKIAAPLQNQARQFFNCRLGQHQQARMLDRLAELLAEDLNQIETERSLAPHQLQ